MPELISEREKSFARDIYSRWAESSGIMLRKLTKAKELEYIGHGAECAVVAQPDGPHRVTAFRYNEMSPDRAKKIFYLQRVLSTLFPHNFPRFYTVFYGNDQDKIPGGSIRQRIWEQFGGRKNDSQYKDSIKYKFEDAINILEQIGIPVSFDTFDLNFDVGPDGGEYYLDTPIFLNIGKFKKAKVIDFMKRHKDKPSGYSNADIRLVSKSIDRLKELGLV